MPTTRKKVIKTVYKDDDDSEGSVGDFSDSGSEAHISDESNSDDEEEIGQATSEDEFVDKNKKKISKRVIARKPISIKTLINKVNKQSPEERDDILISVKDLTEADKLLPSILNLSESDSSDDESTNKPSKKIPLTITTSTSTAPGKDPESDQEHHPEYKDVWSMNIQDNSEDIAKKTFMELQQHNTKIEETKASIENYISKQSRGESNVKDLLALGEDVEPKKTPVKKKSRIKKTKVDSDSEMEDWEEVKESKSIPQQGLQLFVEFPDAACKKKKAVDVEMMMKRKINRTKKEYQVYMHKVHVLCWLGHGNYVSRILNDQEIMGAVLSLVPSKECYPGERVDLKYIEQITSWFKDKLTLKQDKNEEKFKPKAPPLKEILLAQIKSRVVTTKKYIVFIFVAMLRALGLQCRVMFNFVTLPLKPPVFELCSLSTKSADKKEQKPSSRDKIKSNEKKSSAGSKSKYEQQKVAQLDGCFDINFIKQFKNIIQLDGSNDDLTTKTRPLRSTRANKATGNNNENEDMSPPKKLKKNPTKTSKTDNDKETTKATGVKLPQGRTKNLQNENSHSDESHINKHLHAEKDSNSRDHNLPEKTRNLRKTRNNKDHSIGDKINKQNNQGKCNKASKDKVEKQNKLIPPKITVTNENNANVASSFFEEQSNKKSSRIRLSRKRTYSADSNNSQHATKTESTKTNKAAKTRTKSAPGSEVQKSKYFTQKGTVLPKKPKITSNQIEKQETSPEKKRISHRDLSASKTKPKNDVTNDLIDIISHRMKQESPEVKKGTKKGKLDKGPRDPEYLDSDDDFKPNKLSPKPSTSKVIDRRVLSSDEETHKKQADVWCEIFVEELEQWICVDLSAGKIHDSKFIYSRATHPVGYIVGWDNNNYLKDLTRRYVPHWNTVTRKLRAEQPWWNKAIQPWLGPKTARDREENEFLDKMQLEAPLPKSIAEYKNHPLYALKRHLLKFEAIYPSDAATLGFVRGEPVYARECVYVCRSRDTWLKEAKVVRLGETPYKVVKARPKWDKLSNKLITDKPLEVFGPWQVQDYEPPIAENGIVPRNAYGNVELFKACMLPKGTAHIKLPGLNKVARKLNIDCAPAMTGFDFNGGWSHPVYDGFVVCKEYEEIITEAWVEDQEEQERKEREKTDARVYGNWKKLIKGLLIRERIKNKYGFENLSTSETNKNKAKTPRYVVKKK